MADVLKVSPINNMIKELSRPFTAESIKTKIQVLNNSGAIVVSYIDSRNVSERLNTVCPDRWSDDNLILTAGSNNQIYGVECTIIIDNVSRTDVGTISSKVSEVSDPDSRMGGLKILYSDAFKRAGVKWGIGSFLYTLPTTFIPNRYLDGEGNKRRLTDETKSQLQTKYNIWLRTTGISRFGEPLDHGYVEDSQGDIEISEEN